MRQQDRNEHEEAPSPRIVSVTSVPSHSMSSAVSVSSAASRKAGTPSSPRITASAKVVTSPRPVVTSASPKNPDTKAKQLTFVTAKPKIAAVARAPSKQNMESASWTLQPASRSSQGIQKINPSGQGDVNPKDGFLNKRAIFAEKKTSVSPKSGSKPGPKSGPKPEVPARKVEKFAVARHSTAKSSSESSVHQPQGALGQYDKLTGTVANAALSGRPSNPRAAAEESWKRTSTFGRKRLNSASSTPKSIRNSPNKSSGIKNSLVTGPEPPQSSPNSPDDAPISHISSRSSKVSFQQDAAIYGDKDAKQEEENQICVVTANPIQLQFPESADKTEVKTTSELRLFNPADAKLFTGGNVFTTVQTTTEITTDSTLTESVNVSYISKSGDRVQESSTSTAVQNQSKNQMETLQENQGDGLFVKSAGGCSTNVRSLDVTQTTGTGDDAISVQAISETVRGEEFQGLGRERVVEALALDSSAIQHRVGDSIVNEGSKSAVKAVRVDGSTGTGPQTFSAMTEESPMPTTLAIEGLKSNESTRSSTAQPSPQNVYEKLQMSVACKALEATRAMDLIKIQNALVQDITNPAPALPTTLRSTMSSLVTMEHDPALSMKSKHSQPAQRMTPSSRASVAVSKQEEDDDEEEDGEGVESETSMQTASTEGTLNEWKTRRYLVKNSALTKVNFSGVRYRKSRRHSDVHKFRIANFGEILTGVDLGQGWLAIPDNVEEVLFLPFDIGGAKLLEDIGDKDNALKTGWIKKLGPLTECGWRSRYCILREGRLEMFGNDTLSVKKGELWLDPAAYAIPFSELPGDLPQWMMDAPYGFVVDCNPEAGSRRTLHYFDGRNQSNLEAWVEAIMKSVAGDPFCTSTPRDEPTELETDEVPKWLHRSSVASAPMMTSRKTQHSESMNGEESGLYSPRGEMSADMSACSTSMRSLKSQPDLSDTDDMGVKTPSTRRSEGRADAKHSQHSLQRPPGAKASKKSAKMKAAVMVALTNNKLEKNKQNVTSTDVDSSYHTHIDEENDSYDDNDSSTNEVHADHDETREKGMVHDWEYVVIASAGGLVWSTPKAASQTEVVLLPLGSLQKVSERILIEGQIWLRLASGRGWVCEYVGQRIMSEVNYVCVSSIYQEGKFKISSDITTSIPLYPTPCVGQSQCGELFGHMPVAICSQAKVLQGTRPGSEAETWRSFLFVAAEGREANHGWVPESCIPTRRQMVIEEADVSRYL